MTAIKDGVRPRPRLPGVRTLLIAGTGIGLLALAFAYRATLADSLSLLSELHWSWVPVMLVLELASMAAMARNYRRLLHVAGAVVSFRAALAVTYTSNAISVTLPFAGPELAVGYSFRQFVRRGANGPAVAWALLLSGLAASVGFAVLVVAGTAATGNAVAVLAAGFGALLASLPVLALLIALRRPGVRALAQRLIVGIVDLVRRLRRRPTWDSAVVVRTFLLRLIEHRIGRRDRAVVVLVASWNWLADCLCLVAAIAAVGATVPWHSMLLIYVGAVGAAGLGLTPGGLGVVEAALTAELVAAGLDAQHALAAALLYRLVSFWMVTAAGWATMSYGFLRERSHAAPAPSVAMVPPREPDPTECEQPVTVQL